MKSADGGFFVAWRTITFLLVFLGFLALASTGEIPLPVSCGFVLLLGVAFFIGERPEFWHDWMAKVLIWLALGVIGLIALNGKFVSVLYLMLFLVLYKCFSLREALDHLHTLIMSFFMFLACSIITSSATYMAIMFLYIILMMLDLICLTIAREGARVFAGFGTGKTSRAAAGAATTQPFWRRLFLSSLAVGTLILLLTFLIFLILPHGTAYRQPIPFMNARPSNTARVSGYAEDINFNNFSQLKLDTHEVMKVYTAWEDGAQRPLPPTLRLRGQALDSFDLNHWYLQGRHMPKESTKWDEIHFQDATTFQGPILEQSFNQDIHNQRRLFGASMPLRFSFAKSRHHEMALPLFKRRIEWAPEPFKLHLDWQTQGLFVIPALAPGQDKMLMTSYTVYSRLVDDATPLLEALLERQKTGIPNPERLRALNYSPEPNPNLKMTVSERGINTFLPRSDLAKVITRTSRQVAAGPSDLEKIAQLGKWFSTQFQYSLAPQPRGGVHPLESFLTRTHKGHCEYFASAFALLLRAQNIPARVAIGYFSTERHDNGKRTFFTVRQSDAHAWAEVWLDGYGWLTFDPTPPDWRGRNAASPDQFALWERVTQWAQATWQHYVLDYSNTEQQKLMAVIANHPVTQSLRLLGKTLMETAQSLLLLKTDGTRPTNREIYARVILLFFALALFLALVLRFCARARRLAQGKVINSPVAFMNQLVQRLQALGWKRSASQTPAEWIAEILRQRPGDGQLEWVLDLYHRCRFAQEPLTPQDEARAREVIRQLQ